jgi:5-hydroxyisourate hydrolase-like protein (transthyretin family)
MLRRQQLLFAAISIAALGPATLCLNAQATKDDQGWSRKYKTPPPASRIEVTVLKAFNGKPIENAAVIFHPIEGDKDKGVLELKTNEDGKAIIDVIPIGDTVRLQVIANGYQTYGQDYKIDKAEVTMEVKMKRPGAQYSTYGNNGSADNSGQPKSGPGSSGGGAAPAPGNSSGSGSGSGSGSQQTPPANPPK